MGKPLSQHNHPHQEATTTTTPFQEATRETTVKMVLKATLAAVIAISPKIQHGNLNSPESRHTYFFDNGGIRKIAFGASTAWLLLDIASHGFGPNNSPMISALGKDDRILQPARLSDWNTNLVDPDN